MQFCSRCKLLKMLEIRQRQVQEVALQCRITSPFRGVVSPPFQNFQPSQRLGSSNTRTASRPLTSNGPQSVRTRLWLLARLSKLACVGNLQTSNAGRMRRQVG